MAGGEKGRVMAPPVEWMVLKGSGGGPSVAESPAPVVDLRCIHAVGVGVAAVFLDLVLHPLLDVGSAGAEALDPVDHIDHQVEAVDLVADGQFQRSVDVSVLLVTANVEVGMVRAPAVEPADQPWVAMDCC